jgi:hypothetical protein
VRLVGGVVVKPGDIARQVVEIAAFGVLVWISLQIDPCKFSCLRHLRAYPETRDTMW